MKLNGFLTKILPILLFPIGDLIAQTILGEFNFYRLIAIMALAVCFYQWETPMFFKFLDKYKTNWNLQKFIFLKPLFTEENKLSWSGRTFGALLFFNPIWVARHIYVISLGEKHFNFVISIHDIISSLSIGTKSFIATLPIALIGNYIVQAKLPLKHRFLGSVILTSVFAIVYALSYKFF